MTIFIAANHTIECDICGIEKPESMDVWEKPDVGNRIFVCSACDVSPDGFQLIGIIHPTKE